MLKSINESPLYPIVNPRSIVFFGASNNFSAMGTNQLSSLMALGFKGAVYPIHPKEAQVYNLKAYRSVFDLPEVPDLAVLVLPTRIVPQKLEECGKWGITHAIVVSGGFKEIGGNGVNLEEELAQIAGKYRMRFLGPNCIGIANPHHKLNTTFLEFEGSAGYIGMASQSGSLVTQMFNYLSRFGLGFSTALSVGNEANIDIVDCMEYLGACPNTKVIALYIEGITRGRAFVETARSIVPHKPIVALYVGGTDTGRRAGSSHTGALAGPDPLYEGAFRQSGVIRARSVTELFDFCWILGSVPPPRGDRVVILTHSGGPGAAAADSCGRARLTLPTLSAETLEKLGPFVPHTGSIHNPVDITFTKNPFDYFTHIPRVLLEEKNADILLIYFLLPSVILIRALAHMGLPKDEVLEQSNKIIDDQYRSLARLLETNHKTVVGYTFRSLDERLIRGLMDLGIPVFQGPERAARALGALREYYRLRDQLSASTRSGEPTGENNTLFTLQSVMPLPQKMV
jgi:acetyl-CoA synthetase (ADP-forming)